MIDFHIHPHSTMLPAEAASLGRQAGYRTVVLLARCHTENLESALLPLVRAVRELCLHTQLDALAGVELVHVPASLMGETVVKARRLGAALVAAHGESICPHTALTPSGTNMAAIVGGVDLLLHPGLITSEEALCASQQGCALELSLSPWHGLYNGHVARLGLEHNCLLVGGSGAACAGDFVSLALRSAMLRGAGLDAEGLNRVEQGSLTLVSRCLTAQR